MTEFRLNVRLFPVGGPVQSQRDLARIYNREPLVNEGASAGMQAAERLGERGEVVERLNAPVAKLVERRLWKGGRVV